MRIAIKNAQDETLGIVDGVSDPQREFDQYYKNEFNGATSWEVSAIPADQELAILRKDKIGATQNHGLSLIGSIIPALGSIEMVDLMVELFQAGAFVAGFPAPGSDMERVKDIYVYTKQKIATAKTATKDQLEAYDPATDTGWPT